MPAKPFLEKLKTDVILGAEGYVYELERRGYVKAGPYVPEVVLDHPEALEQLHRDFLLAGGEVMVAMTYYAHRDKLKDIGREGELEAMNKEALRIAKKVAAETDAYVAGNICNTWVYNPEDKNSHDEVRAMFREQVGWAAEAGVDLIIAETIEFLGEALIAVEVIKEFKLPAMVTLAPTADKTRDGFTWVEACKQLEAAGAEVVGLNCIQGPNTMLPLLQDIRKAVKCFVAAQPVPYCTNEDCRHFQYFEDEKTGERVPPYDLEPYLHTRTEMAAFAKAAKELGINYIGICCGAGPHHVRAMAEALGKAAPNSKYSPDLSKHSQLGKTTVKKHNQQFLKLQK